MKTTLSIMVLLACVLMEEDETRKTGKVNNKLIKKTVQGKHVSILAEHILSIL